VGVFALTMTPPETSAHAATLAARRWRPRENVKSSEEARRASLMTTRAEVPVAQLREAFERSGLSKGELARRLGWFAADTYRVGRALGIYRRHNNGPAKRQEFTSYENALALCRAMNCDPVDLGL
jgi:hypothetical protein